MPEFNKDQLENAEILSFKIIQNKYIETTIKEGKICLGCADFYSYQEKISRKRGQGDKDEGVFARIHEKNVLKIDELKRLYGTDLKTKRNGEFLDFKLRSVINMPIYCFYSINASDRDVDYSDHCESPEEFVRTFKFKIPKKVFEDFIGDGFENFGIMKFKNHTNILSIVADSLTTKGCTQELKEHRINYVVREKIEWCCPEDHPMELFYKDISFGHQKEARIIVQDSMVRFADQVDEKNKTLVLENRDVKELVERQPIKADDIYVEIPVTIKKYDDGAPEY